VLNKELKKAVFRIQIRIQIRIRIHLINMFLGLPDPDPTVLLFLLGFVSLKNDANVVSYRNKQKNLREKNNFLLPS